MFTNDAHVVLVITFQFVLIWQGVNVGNEHSVKSELEFSSDKVLIVHVIASVSLTRRRAERKLSLHLSRPRRIIFSFLFRKSGGLHQLPVDYVCLRSRIFVSHFFCFLI